MSNETETKFEPKANLGLATTLELIQELATRAEMAKYGDGEDWSQYRTVDHH